MSPHCIEKCGEDFFICCAINKSLNVLEKVHGVICVLSLIFIGQADSIEQFFDTLSHESDHAQDSILRYFGISHGTEDAAWLQGYIMRGISKWLKKDGYI